MKDHFDHSPERAFGLRKSGISPQQHSPDRAKKPVFPLRASLVLRKKWLLVLVCYAALLIWSHGVRRAMQVDIPSNYHVATLKAVSRDEPVDQSVRLAYREFGAAASDSLPVLVLLHGSPMGSESFDDLAPWLGQFYRVIVPDLPGFGFSTREIPDYSIVAHARYILQLLDSLQIAHAHLVGYSMGGGVALSLADAAPDRVASIDLLSAIGVQELELLGDYHMNRAVHAAQYAAIWLLQEALPHFGVIDRSLLNLRYARNFYDTDQRPLREILLRYRGPLLIQHGEHDKLVPVAAAKEHFRLTPQSELRLYDAGHGMAFLDWQAIGADIRAFVDRVEAGQAAIRATATPERVAGAAKPFDPAMVPPAHGIAFVLILFFLIVATFVSEDLTCIGAGLMIAKGTIGFVAGTAACFAGIFIGDLGLYWAGKYLGRPTLRKAPLRWFLREKEIQKSTKWFAVKGPAIILASRFLPGSRLPTYFAAGMLQMKFARFALYFLLAAAVWTPLLVGLASIVGNRLHALFAIYQKYAVLGIAATILSVLFIVKIVVPFFTYKGRRLLLSAWRRKVRWEFWSPCFFYLPIFFYVLCLGLKYRSLALFTLANPGMPEGGFIGESKYDILQKLNASSRFVAKSALLPASQSLARKVAVVEQFMQSNGLEFPIVLKPDAGQRGSGVVIALGRPQMVRALENASSDLIVQEYVAGFEFGVFYVRYPSQQKGTIFSITEKRFPTIRGDGEKTVEELILADDRAVCMAPFFLKLHEKRLFDVLEKGKTLKLVELGTHSRGALFLDGRRCKSEALERTIDAISRQYDGFYFGRFDIRTASVDDFVQGNNFKIVELNGVTSEATHIYDPQNSVWLAYRVLMQQWRMAFEIGEENRRAGLQPTSMRTLLRLLVAR